MIYELDITANIHDADYNGVIRASALMRYIQTAAQNQLTENGMSYEELRDKYKKAFLLSRIRLDFSEPIRAYDRITALTYPCESKAYSFLRCYAIKKDGEIIGRAVALWALVDTETHGLVKARSFDLGLEVHEPHELALERFYMPSELSCVGEYEVRYGDVDQNRHMNNTKYPDMYSSFLPLENKRIRAMAINYYNEAPMGERLRVLSACREENKYYFRTVREDGKINSEAEILLENL